MSSFGQMPLKQREEAITSIKNLLTLGDGLDLITTVDTAVREIIYDAVHSRKGNGNRDDVERSGPAKRTSMVMLNKMKPQSTYDRLRLLITIIIGE